MSRWYPAGLLLLIALLFGWRKAKELPFYLDEEPQRERRAPDAPAEGGEKAGLAAPEPVLQSSLRSRFSTPDGGGGLASERVGAGAEPSDDPEALGSPALLRGARSGAAGGPGAAPSAGGRGAPGGPGASAAAGADAATDAGAAANPGAARGGGTRAPNDARAAFDGSHMPPTGSVGGTAASGAAGGAGGAGSASAAGSAGRGGGLLGALAGFGGAAGGRQAGTVEGRAVGGDAGAPGLPGASAGGLAAGAGPGPVEGRAVEAPLTPFENPQQRPVAAQPTPGEARPHEPEEGARMPPRIVPSEVYFRADANKPNNIPTGQVVREGQKGAVVFVADMDIDADGAGGWHRNDPVGQSQTSLRYPNGDSLNPGRLPFMVVPTDFSRTHPDVRLGDYGIISYNGKSVYTIIGDRSPAGVIGEASISAAATLGINADPVRGGVDSGVRYVILPGTADRTPPTDAAAIQARGAQLAKEFGIPFR